MSRKGLSDVTVNRASSLLEGAEPLCNLKPLLLRFVGEVVWDDSAGTLASANSSSS